MGKLSDITTKASNRSSGASKGYHAISSPKAKENVGGSKSPHFMTPTYASKQSATPTSDYTKPKSAGNHFLRRIGLRRMTGTPRAKQELQSIRSNRASFPSKLAHSSYTTPDESPHSSDSQSSSRDKPLPTPPVAHLDAIVAAKSTVTLIDVNNNRQADEQKWPALQPKRVPSGSLQDAMRESGHELRKQASTIGDRYPKLSGIDNISSKTGGLYVPISRYSPPDQRSRKGPSSFHLKPPISDIATAATDLHDPFQDPVDANKKVNDCTGHPSAVSTEAIAIEKTAKNHLANIPQTRTSSVRTRLSAADELNDLDMSNEDHIEPTKPLRHNSWRQSRHSRRSSAERALLPEGTKESFDRHAPAKSVGGKRRSIQPRRPGSRDSTHDGVPSTVPNASTKSSHILGAHNKNAARKKGHRSSIPLPVALSPSKSSKDESVKLPSPAADFGIFEDNATTPLMQATSTPTSLQWPDAAAVEASAMTTPVQAASTPIDHPRPKAAVPDVAMAKSLECIDESPRHAYTIRRLSTKGPGYGPKLSISPSADRYILGESDKENDASTNKDTKSSKSLEKAAELSGKISIATQRRLSRPSSSLGPKPWNVAPTDYKRPTRSMDLNNSSQHPTQGSSKKASLITNASSVNDPFYDAPEQPEQSTPRTKTSGSIAQDEGWISPLKKPDDTSAATTPTINPNGEYDPFKYDASTSTRTTKPPAQPARNPPATPTKTSLSKYASSIPTGRANPPLSTLPPHSPNSATPPKSFTHRQNNLGAALGNGSSQLSLPSPLRPLPSRAPRSHSPRARSRRRNPRRQAPSPLRDPRRALV
ncbi:uncharacterized protein KY384_001694 [Bacidia gigantensis]|uniref:uncharacterized protein n=1 Tax=Bacidia gigantensis TaxID=2732470 RepID=UPI001D048415|nr:uncharacterized protein KY384_001694 [Bacidia gigantensis]KAG8533952.1 hypothetical protein KY384_001694 [Bacidia gigantensis]